MKKFPILILSLAIILVNSAFSFAQQVEESGKEHKASQADLLSEAENLTYKISPNDLLDIEVYDEPDLTRTLRVGEDRTIVFPLLGVISIKGLTPRELESKITELLGADYLVNPQVTVLVKERAKVSVIGAVKNPGQEDLTSGMTLVDAIAQAGGFLENVTVQNIKLIHTDENDNKQTTTFDASKIFENENNEASGTLLKAGDLVIVGETAPGEESFVVVVGEVVTPGRYVFKKDMTVIEAVAMAGGLKDAAAGDAVKIIRTENGQRKTIPVPLASILKGRSKGQDISLMPGDVIMVPESFF